MDKNNIQFSEREKDVIQLLLQGKGNKQIASALGIANRTVEFHLSNIYAKLEVSSRAEAILKLTESDLRKSTGDYQVNSTVDQSQVSTKNDFKSISWRSLMRKPYYILSGIFITIVIAAVIIFRVPKQDLEPETIPSTAIPTLIPTEVSSPTPLPTGTPITNVAIPPHTVNGYTATIEGYYADISHLIFHVRVEGGGVEFPDERYFSRLSSPDIYDEYGNMINASGGFGPAADPSVFEISFQPVTFLKGDRIKGQLAFDIVDAPNDYNKKLAQFSFDFDIPLYPETRFFPKQTVTANGLEILLDSVTVTPTYTQVYLCLISPSVPPGHAGWSIGVQTTLQIDGQEVLFFNSSGLFSSATGSYWGTRSEPYWVPPVKNGNCYKVGFQAGSMNPTSLTLNIPVLEKLELQVPFVDKLPVNYPGLGMRDAYSKYLEEIGNTYKGPWTFNVELKP